MASGKTSAPGLGLRFEVTIDGVSVGTWSACDGLNVEREVVEWNEGGQNDYVHRLPGRLKYSNVKLTRGVNGDSGKLAAWFSSLQTSMERKTASITLFDAGSNKVASWSLVGVWPVKYSGPSFSSDGEAVAKEVLELAHNGFSQEGGGA